MNKTGLIAILGTVAVLALILLVSNFNIQINVNGKEDTIATIQIDFYSARRFSLSFINAHGEKESPVIIHRAIMGSFERFFAFLIEQYAGAFPVWLSPVQAIILPVSEKQAEYAKAIEEKLRAGGIQVRMENSGDTLGKRVRKAKASKTPYFLVLGEREAESQTIAVESRDEGKLGPMTAADFLTRLRSEIDTRKNTGLFEEKTS